MAKTIETISENGVFKPLSPLNNITENKKVTLVIKDYDAKKFDILSLASTIYDGLLPKDIEDIEKLTFEEATFQEIKTYQCIHHPFLTQIFSLPP